ncbi:MAG: hypothetical protein ACRETU_00920 [Steroidobacterales bacterium]
MAGARIRIWVRSLLGVALILGLPAILIYALRTAYQSSPEPGTIASSVFDYDKLRDGAKAPAVAGAQATSATEPAPGTTRVYECRRNGQSVYSSQPCGNDSVVRDINTQKINTYRPPPTVEPEASVPEGGECAKVREETDEINARMRQPYTNAEGGYYRERLRKLSNRRYELKCGR